MDLLTPARTWAPNESPRESDRAPDHANDPTADHAQDRAHDHAHDHDQTGPDHRMPVPQQITMFLSVVGPIAGLLAAILILWHRGPASVGWPEIIAMIVLYALTGFGVTIGYHRLLTHKSFETPRAMRLLLAICGSIGGQGAVIRWCATHRRHHQTSDRPGDPHSPHIHGDTPPDFLRGMWHAHMGWLFHRDEPGTAQSIPDLLADPALMLIDRLYFFWVFIGILIPGIFCGLIEQQALGTFWRGFFSGMVWGGLLRICLLQHVTWSINSVCHVWGQRPFKSADHSANNWIFAVLALGEGWHNNHHAFPTSARQGLKWWQFDSSWLIIRAMSLVGLAKNIRTPSDSALAAKQH